MSKRNYSYFIIKPDGVRRFPEIAEFIEKEFTSVRYYKVDNFKGIIKKLQYKNYDQNGEKFAESFESYLYAEESVYGNDAIAIIVSQNIDENSYEEFTKKVYNTKLSIRNKYVNNDVAIATNYRKSIGELNYIRFIAEQGEQSKPKVLNELGHHRLSDLNIIHCPDPNIEDTLVELNILCKERIIDEEKLLEPHMIKEAKQYRSVTGCCKEYKDQKPDISRFVRNEIEQYETR